MPVVNHSPLPNHSSSCRTLMPVGNPDIAHQFVQKASSVGLNVTYDIPTLGDGKCFYHAVIECLHSSHIERNQVTDSYQLRKDVVDFVDQNRNSSFVLIRAF